MSKRKNIYNKKTIERLRRNLKKQEITEKLQDNQLSYYKSFRSHKLPQLIHYAQIKIQCLKLWAVVMLRRGLYLSPRNTMSKIMGGYYGNG